MRIWLLGMLMASGLAIAGEVTGETRATPVTSVGGQEVRPAASIGQEVVVLHFFAGQPNHPIYYSYGTAREQFDRYQSQGVEGHVVQVGGEIPTAPSGQDLSTLLLDDGSFFARIVGDKELPLTVVFAKDGRLASQVSGEPPSERWLRKNVFPLLREADPEPRPKLPAPEVIGAWTVVERVADGETLPASGWAWYDESTMAMVVTDGGESETLLLSGAGAWYWDAENGVMVVTPRVGNDQQPIRLAAKIEADRLLLTQGGRTLVLARP